MTKTSGSYPWLRATCSHQTMVLKIVKSCGVVSKQINTLVFLGAMDNTKTLFGVTNARDKLHVGAP